MFMRRDHLKTDAMRINMLNPTQNASEAVFIDRH